MIIQKIKPIISLSSLFLFTVWIMPLGAFITPEKEEKACNGQRAICLCSQLLAKQRAKRVESGGALIKNTTSLQQSVGSPSNHYFIHPHITRNWKAHKTRSYVELKHFYKSPVLDPTDKVPREKMS